MSIINDYYMQALFAMAAYSDLFEGITGDAYTSALEKAEMPNSLASEFAANWRVIHQQSDPDGFSATVFQSVDGGPYHLSFRGTEPDSLNDLAADADLLANGVAHLQVMSIVNYYYRLTADKQDMVPQYELVEVDSVPASEPYIIKKNGIILALRSAANAEGLGLGSGADFTLSGHSLGGHLLSAFALLFPNAVASGYTFNGAGINSGPGEGFTDLAGFLAANISIPNLSPVTGSNSTITNLIADAGEDVVAGTGDQIGTEQRIFIENQILTGNHGKAHLVDSLAVYDMFSSMDSSLTIDEITVMLEAAAHDDEKSLENMVNALGDLLEEGSEVTVGDRDGLHGCILELNSARGQQARFSSMSIASLATTDETGIRAAGREPATLYAMMTLIPFAVNGVAGLYDSFLQEIDPDTLSNQFIEDRAKFLYSWLHEDEFVRNDHGDPINFLDMASGKESNHIDLINISARFTWGTENGEEIFGLWGDNADHLYGMGGNDILLGDMGDDYMEGGKGSDKLYGGLGDDTFAIIGTDESYDIFDGGWGKDTILGSAQDDTIRVHQLTSDNSIEVIDGGAGENIIAGTSGNDTIDLTGIAVTHIDRIEGGDGQDTITGTINADKIYGGADEDTLVGAGGDDLLVGGDGVDTYVIQGNDTIQDTGQNYIVYDGHILAGGFLQEGASSTYRSMTNGNYTLTFNSPGHLVLNGTDSVTFQNQTSANDFANGEFGIRLLEEEAEPISDGATIEGDLTPAVYLTSDGNPYYKYDQWGNIITTADAAANREDILYDTPDNDVLLGHGGNDYLNASRGGDDTLDGGSGDDVLFGGIGKDILLGGGDSDALFGGDDNDRLYADEKQDLTSGNLGELEVGTGARGDLLSGNLGDDQLFGRAGNDALAGGSGNDILYGGAGDDVIEGDLDLYGGDNLWSVTRSMVGSSYQRVYENVSWSLPVEQGNDLIYGGSGNDWIYAQGGNDFVDGGSDDDVIFGEAGDDILLGQDGNDLLYGDNDNNPTLEYGADYLDGGAGNDGLWGFGGKDTLIGGLGDDTLVGDSSDTPAEMQDADYLDGGEGNDSLWGMGGADTLIGGEGNDYLVGMDGQDSLTGGLGDDVLIGDSNDPSAAMHDADFLDGGDGNDSLWGNGGADTLIGGSGDDELHGDSSDTPSDAFGDDSLAGGDGNDTLVGYSGDDTLTGGTGDDALWGGEGNDIYLFGRGDGQDTIYETSGEADTLRLADIAPADVSVTRDELDLIFTVTGTTDSLVVKSWFSGEAAQIEHVEFSDGTVWDAETIQNKTVAAPATDGGDVVSGTETDDTLGGEAGEDYIQAGGGDDLIVGGSGNDFLAGGAGADIYSFSRGFGQDIVYENLADSSVDTVLFTSEISSSDVAVSWNDDNLYLSIKGTSDTVTLAGWNNPYTTDWSTTTGGITIPTTDLNTFLSQNSYHAVEQVVFAQDGTIWTADYIATLVDTSSLPPGGTGTDDWLMGTSENDTLYGFGGRDTLFGLEGNDYLNGGTGNDYLYGHEGNDTLVGEDGVDRLLGYEGDDYLDGGDDFDYLYGGDGNDRIFGGLGNDWLRGEVGDDYLEGNAGNDSMGGGSGIDVLVGGVGNDSLVGDGGHDTLEGNEGDDRLFGGTGNDILRGGADVDTLYGNQDDDYLNGGSGDDYLDGGEGNDQLLGASGNDELFGQEGNDTLDGGPGNDILDGGSGVNTYLFGVGSGQDTIDVGGFFYTIGSPFLQSSHTLRFADGIVSSNVSVTRDHESLVLSINGTTDSVSFAGWALEWTCKYDIGWSSTAQVEFADGTLWNSETLIAFVNVPITPSSGADYLYGTRYADTISGLDGNDQLYGYCGNDILIGGEGADLLDGSAGDDILDGGGGDDSLNGGDGNNVLDGGSGNDLLVTNSGDDFLYGGSGNDSLYGGVGSDFLEGGSGDDVLVGDDVEILVGNYVDHFVEYDGDCDGDGDSCYNDILNGGAGNDTLEGGVGDDVYLFGRGFGQDSINELHGLNDSNEPRDYRRIDTIRFLEGVAPTDIIVSQDGLDLNLSIQGTGDQVTVVRWFDTYTYGTSPSEFEGDDADAPVSPEPSPWDASNNYTIEQVEFADGTVWSFDEITVMALNSPPPNTVPDLTIPGTASNDVLTGGLGNDTLTGGAGNDILTGGGGSDTYVYNPGDGVDTIIDTALPGEGNILSFGDGIVAEDLSLDLGSLLIKTGKPGDEIHIDNFNPNDAYGDHAIDTFQFADGTTLSYQQLIEKGFDLTGTSGDDIINGTNVVDRITGGGGNDIINSGDGDDVIHFGLGDGNDIITDTSGNDTLVLDDSLSLADTWIERVGNDVSVTLADGSSALIQNGALAGSNIENIQFGDGTIQDIESLLALRARNYDLTIDEDNPTSGTIELGNAGDGVIYSIDQGPANGDFTVNDDGTWSFTPNQDYNGDDQILVKVTNVAGETTTSTINLTINPVNDLPVAPLDESHTMQDIRTLFGALGVTDVDGDVLAYSVSNGPANGSLTLDQDGNWNYQADDLFMGNDSAQITIDDGNGGLVTSTLNFDVLVSSPTIDTGDQNLLEDENLEGQLQVTNPIGGNLSYEVVDTTDHGAFTVNADGFFSYDPAANYNGADAITLKVTNEYGLSSTKTISLDIIPVNDLPVAPTEESRIMQDVRAMAGAIEATDVDGDILNYSVSTGPANGTLTIDQDGSWDYQAADLFMGADFAVVTIDDGNGGIVTTTLNFDVRVSAPTINELGVIDLLEDGAVSDQLTVTNPIGGNLIYEVVDAVDHGTFQLNDDGSFSYTPAANYNGSDLVTMKVTNEYGLTDTITIDYAIEAVNDIPVVQDNAPVSLDGVLTASGMIDAFDVDGDVLAYTVDGAPQHGTLTIDDQGNWLYAADDGYYGTDQATIVIDDGNGGVVSTALDFTVNVYEQGDWVIAANGPDALKLQDISTSELQLTRSGDDLLVTVAERGSITVQDYFTAPENGLKLLDTLEGSLNLAKEEIIEMESDSHWWKNESVKLGKSTTENLVYGTDVIDKTYKSKHHHSIFGRDNKDDHDRNEHKSDDGKDKIYGSKQNDVLFGASGNDKMEGNYGDDTLIGGAGNDSLDGEEGNDTLYGDSGNDELEGGDGNDTLIGGDGHDELEGGAANDWLFGGNGTDKLYGNDGDDLLYGGAGNDTLIGGDGNDTYFLNQGDGYDVISEKASSSHHWWKKSQPENNDTITLGEGIEMDDVSFVKHGSKLILQYGEDDIVTIKDQFKDKNAIERVELSDGSYLTDGDINQLIQDMAGFAVNEGIALNSVSDVWQNAELMTMVTAAWHQAA